MRDGNSMRRWREKPIHQSTADHESERILKFSETISKARNRKKLSLRELADKVNVSHSTLHRYDRGKGLDTINVLTVHFIAHALSLRSPMLFEAILQEINQ